MGAGSLRALAGAGRRWGSEDSSPAAEGRGRFTNENESFESSVESDVVGCHRNASFVRKEMLSKFNLSCLPKLPAP